MTQPNKRWNLFARELEDILTAHNLHLGLIDDRTDIHREKIRRLQKSLSTPKNFPVLNPEEMELLIEKFDLSEEERVRLRAALLATAIERMLMSRIDQDNALLASEKIGNILRETLLAQFELDDELGSIRSGDSESIEDNEEDMKWNRAWSALDGGDLARQLSNDVISYREGLRWAKEADACYTESLTELDGLGEDSKSLQIWNIWHGDADAGRVSTRARLDDLGED